MIDIQVIDVGTTPGDGTGTPLRQGWQWANANFATLAAAVLRKADIASLSAAQLTDVAGALKLVLQAPDLPAARTALGLGHVADLAPADLPVSTATQAALNTLASRVTANGASLAGILAGADPALDSFVEAYGRFLADESAAAAMSAAIGTLQAALTAEVARAGTAEGTNAAGIAANTAAISAEAARATGVEAGLALKGRQLTGAGLATGGGDLTADRVITVPKASPADVAAGTDDAKALTALAVAAALAAKAGTGRQVTGAGLATGGGDLSADRVITVPKASAAMVAAGTDDASAVTPLALAGPLAGKVGTGRQVLAAGLATGGGALAADLTIAVAKATAAQAAAGTDDTTAVTPLALATPLAGKVPTTRQVLTGAGLSGGGALAADLTIAIAGNGITNALLAPMPSLTLKANLLGAAAAAADVSPSALLDAAFGSTVGNILVRGASGWTSLAAATAGQVLTANGAGASPSYQALPASGVALPLGQCRLTYTSTAQVTLLPFGGNQVMVNGALRTIPDTGWPLANTGLTAGTGYYVYAPPTGTALEASATGHVLDTTNHTGMRVKSGDPTRTLVGWVNMDAGTPGTFADTPAKRWVATYFNRFPRALNSSASQSQSTASGSAQELNAAVRASFFSWGDGLIGVYSGQTSNNAVWVNYTQVALDGTAIGAASSITIGSASNPFPCAASGAATPSEGQHYLTGLGWVTGGTGLWTGQVSGLAIL